MRVRSVVLQLSGSLGRRIHKLGLDGTLGSLSLEGRRSHVAASFSVHHEVVLLRRLEIRLIHTTIRLQGTLFHRFLNHLALKRSLRLFVLDGNLYLKLNRFLRLLFRLFLLDGLFHLLSQVKQTVITRTLHLLEFLGHLSLQFLVLLRENLVIVTHFVDLKRPVVRLILLCLDLLFQVLHLLHKVCHILILKSLKFLHSAFVVRHLQVKVLKLFVVLNQHVLILLQ